MNKNLSYLIKKSILKYKELQLFLKGYGDVLRELPIQSLSTEHKKLKTILPVYNFILKIFYKLSLEDKRFIDLHKVIYLVYYELESIEATMEIFLDATDVADLKEIESEIDNKNMGNFSKWNF